MHYYHEKYLLSYQFINVFLIHLFTQRLIFNSTQDDMSKKERNFNFKIDI